MQSFSIGLAANYILAWVLQPFVKSRLSNSIEKGELHKKLANQLQGLSLQTRGGKTLIWLHAKTLATAASFGEIVAHFEENNNIQFLWTTEEDDPDCTFKMTGIHQHLPLDYPMFVNKFLEGWKPDAVVWLSNTIRPVLLYKVMKSKVPAIYANAELTSLETRKYFWFPSFIKGYLSCFDRILAKSDEAAKRLRRAKAPRVKLEVLGMMQNGTRALTYDEIERSRFASILNNRPIWFAAHAAAGEIAALGKAQRRVSRMAQGLLLIIHMDDQEQAIIAASKLSALSLRVQIYKHASPLAPETDILISYGLKNLGMWFRLAPVCFLGGSLVQAGGADPFEAAALGSAILHGPYTQTYQNDFERLLDAGGARMVYNSEMLSSALVETLSPERAAEMAHAAWEICSAGAEVNDRVIELLDGYLEKEKNIGTPA